MAIEIETEREVKTRLMPLYNLVLINDEFHTYQYVVEMLTDLFQFHIEKAIKHTIEVDSSGSTIVFSGPLEHAEMKQELIHNYGADSLVESCEGSMSAKIESI